MSKYVNKRGKHNKAEPEIRKRLLRIEALDGVTRLLLGRREACRHRFTPGTIRLQRTVRGGLLLKAYTDHGVREITVLAADATTLHEVEAMADGD